MTSTVRADSVDRTASDMTHPRVAGTAGVPKDVTGHAPGAGGAEKVERWENTSASPHTAAGRRTSLSGTRRRPSGEAGTYRTVATATATTRGRGCGGRSWWRVERFMSTIQRDPAAPRQAPPAALTQP
nr:hypothetical protein KPHV_06610 [Kitasatospora purpeofusca]